MPCTTPADCIASTNPCQMATCTGGVCGVVNLPQGKACSNTGGRLTCNASGMCTMATYVFVTHSVFASGLGGTLGADGDCQNAAGAAKLAGVWASWTSGGAAGVTVTSPSMRFTQAKALASAQVPFHLLDDTEVATGWTGLTTQALLQAIDLDETGAPVQQDAEVWTGTTMAGTATDDTCNDWSVSAGANAIGSFGIAGMTGPTWSSGTTTLTCGGSIMAHLYCFQQ
jgi:hypothetical protein